LAGILLALLLWALPWLSLHDTHHAFEQGETACTVAQIVHSQGAGILPAAASLVAPLPVALIPVPVPAILACPNAPCPAARSPPV
jgi:hypothetical protein